MTDQPNATESALYESDSAAMAVPEDTRDYTTLYALLDEDVQLASEIQALEDQLKEKKERHKGLIEISLPDAVRAFDVTASEITLPNGVKIALEDKCYASITEANKSKAHAWLEENGHGALLRWKYTIEFGKDEGKLAKSFQRMVSALFPEREITVVLGKTPTECGNALVKVMEDAFPKHELQCETTVNANSLRAFVKKNRKKITLPDTITVFAPTVATITRPAPAPGSADDPFADTFVPDTNTAFVVLEEVAPPPDDLFDKLRSATLGDPNE